LKVSGGEEEWNLEAMPLSPSQLGLVLIPPRRDLRVRVRMEYHKKDGFCMPKVMKQLTGAYQSLRQVATGIHESILMQKASNHVIYSLYDKREVYNCQRF